MSGAAEVLVLTVCICIAVTTSVLAFWIQAKSSREQAQTIAFLTQTRSMIVKTDADVREVLADPDYVKNRRAQSPRVRPSIPSEEDLRAAVIAGRDRERAATQEGEVLLEDPEPEDLGAPPPAAHSDTEQYVEEHDPIPGGGQYAQRG